MISLIFGIKKKDKLIYKTETDLQHRKQTYGYQREREWEGKNWKFEIHEY